MHTQELADEIRRRAHELYLQRKGKPGTELDDWLRAEEEVVKAKNPIVDIVDEASMESFPASDPPAY